MGFFSCCKAPRHAMSFIVYTGCLWVLFAVVIGVLVFDQTPVESVTAMRHDTVQYASASLLALAVLAIAAWAVFRACQRNEYAPVPLSGDPTKD